MKPNTRNDIQEDKIAAIGIGAMIVFIALILVAAVAAAVIIQTAEKLQQNAQTTGDDTADNMAGKVLISAGFVANGDAGNDVGNGFSSTEAYMFHVRLAPGSEPAPLDEISFQFFCDVGQQGAGNPSFTEHELAQIMDLMGEQMSGEEMAEMLNFLDPENKGEVTFDDFMDVMKKI